MCRCKFMGSKYLFPFKSNRSHFELGCPPLGRIGQVFRKLSPKGVHRILGGGVNGTTMGSWDIKKGPKLPLFLLGSCYIQHTFANVCLWGQLPLPMLSTPKVPHFLVISIIYCLVHRQLFSSITLFKYDLLLVSKLLTCFNNTHHAARPNSTKPRTLTWIFKMISSIIFLVCTCYCASLKTYINNHQSALVVSNNCSHDSLNNNYFTHTITTKNYN